MDANKMKSTAQPTNINIGKWKSPEYRKNVVKKCIEGVIKESGFPLERLAGLAQYLGRYEAKVNAAAKNEVEYFRWLSDKVKSLSSQLKTKPHPSNSTGSVENFSVQDGNSANVDWKEQLYQRAQRMNSAYFPRVYAHYQQMKRKLQELESSSQEPNTVTLEKVRFELKIIEYFISLFRVSKCQITPKFKERLDKAEMIIQKNYFSKNVSSHNQRQHHSANVQPRQQSGLSHSSISQVKILETKLPPQALATQNYHMMKGVSQQDKMSLQQRQVAKQHSNSQQDVNHLSTIEGAGNTVQQQTQGAQKAIKAFSASVNSQGTSASPLIENSNKMCLQKQQVAKQYNNPQQEVNQPSIIKGAGNTVQQQTQGAKTVIKAFSASVKSQGTLASPLIENSSKMCLQKQQVAKQDNNPQQDVYQLSIIKGAGNTVQQQTQGAQKEIKAFSASVNSQGTSASPLIENSNKMCLKKQQVTKQYNNSQQDVNQPSIIKGAGDTVQQRTQGAQKEIKAFSAGVNSQGISASPLIENSNKMCLQKQQVTKQCNSSKQDVTQLSIIKGTSNNVQQATKAFSVGATSQGSSTSPLIVNQKKPKEFSQKPTLTSGQPSAAMQRLLNALTSISSEALSAAVSEIRDVVYSDDVIPGILINEPPMMVQQEEQPGLIPQTGTNLASDIEQCSQARYITSNDFVPTGRKRTRSMDAIIAFDTSSIYASSCDSEKLTDAEKPHFTSDTSQIKKQRIEENCSLSEEIKEINNRLIDCEIVIEEKDSTQSEDGEGLVIKILFNAVTVNQNIASSLSADKKTIIKPLSLLVPTSYPLLAPVILDKMPLEASKEDLQDLSKVAKSKLILSLRCLNQPWSLKDIAILWEKCAREAIIEAAKVIGGGTFSSIYGGWKVCQN